MDYGELYVMITGHKLMQMLPVDSWATPIQVCYTIIYIISATICNIVTRIFLRPSDATAFSNAHFGQGIIPILLDNVGCSGSESQLTDCPYDPGTSDCSHSDDAGVRCQAGQMYIHQ